MKRIRPVQAVQYEESNPSSQKTGSHPGAGITDIAVHQDSQDKKRKKKKRKENLPPSSEGLVRQHHVRPQGMMPRGIVMHLAEAEDFITTFMRNQGLCFATSILHDSVIM